MIEKLELYRPDNSVYHMRNTTIGEIIDRCYKRECHACDMRIECEVIFGVILCDKAALTWAERNPSLEYDVFGVKLSEIQNHCMHNTCFDCELSRFCSSIDWLGSTIMKAPGMISSAFCSLNDMQGW